MKLAMEQGALDQVLNASPSARERRPAAASEITPRISGGVATIPVQGPLFYQPSWIHSYFGIDVTTYAGLADAVRMADANPLVQSIDFAIYSPGGSVDGLYDFLSVLGATQKPTRAVVDNLCASAAYAIATACDSIVATNEAATFGSVGVVLTLPTNSPYSVEITSTEAPLKRVDPTSPEGAASWRGYLDQLHQLMAEGIAKGRKTSVDKVNADYGRGAVLTAREALRRGMIDQVLPSQAGAAKKGSRMNKAELRTAHPALYEEIVAEGEAKERDRCTAHVVGARGSGLTERAMTAIEKGEAITSTIQMEYQMAAVAKRELNARAQDPAPVVVSTPTAPDAVSANDAAAAKLMDGMF